MTPEQKKTFNTGVGSLFLALGLSAWGFAAHHTFVPQVAKPAPTQAAPTTDKATCIQTLGALGYSTKEIPGGKFEVNQASLAGDPKEKLLIASTASTVCKMKMESFCMGSACATSGISMRLAPATAEAAAQAGSGASAPGAVAASAPKDTAPLKK